MYIYLSEAIPNNQPLAGNHRDNYGNMIQTYNRITVLVNMDTVKHIKRIDDQRSVMFFIDGSDMKILETPEQISAILYDQQTSADTQEDEKPAPKKRGRKPKVQVDEQQV